MSEKMEVLGTNFQIEPSQEQAATEVMRAMARETIEQEGLRSDAVQKEIERVQRTVDLLSLDQLIEAWGWRLVRAKEEPHPIIDIALQERVSSEEDDLFENLAPFVKAGSYVDLGGDNCRWWSLVHEEWL